MKIPSDNNWTQTNSGDILGVLHDTQNISLDADGKLQVSKKAFNRLNNTDASASGLGYILSLKYYNGQYFALTVDDAFLFDLGDGGSYSPITLSTGVALNSDAEVCFGRVYMTTNNNLDYYDGSITASVEALNADVPHPLCVFESQESYKLAIGNGNTVKILNSSNDSSTTLLTLPATYEVTTMAYRSSYLYIGTRNKSGGDAKVYIWDGTANTFNYEVPVGAFKVYSIIPYGQTVAFLTSKGQLCEIQGTTAVQLSAFPVFYKQDAIWDDGTNVAYIGKVMHRGMVSVGNKIYINVNGDVDSGFMPEMKHGLWVFDPKRGLYHRSYHSLDRAVVETPSVLSSNTLTISTHNLKTGDQIIFIAIGSLTGVKTATKYYVSVESSTTIKIALSRKALQNGNYVTIGGAVGGSSVKYVPNTDWGAGYSQFQGAITAINPLEPISKGWESPVIWASRISDFTDTAFYAIYGFTDAWNIGRFTTQRILSAEITNTWTKLRGFIDGALLDNEKVIVKYKKGIRGSTPTEVFQGLWASATTITSVSSTQKEDEWSDIEVGDELTIVDGYGRGYTTHVTAISINGSDYTITVDESIGSSTKSVYFYADNFKKAGVFTNVRPVPDIFEDVINTKSPWVQLKIELRGFSPSVTMLDLGESTDKASK